LLFDQQNTHSFTLISSIDFAHCIRGQSPSRLPRQSSFFVSLIDPQLVLHLARSILSASAFKHPPTSHLSSVASTQARRKNPIKCLPRSSKFKKRFTWAVQETT
jgi:hypothetical protein